MTHIIMLTNTVAPDSLGGLERYVRELSARLVSRDCSVTVIAKRSASEQPCTELADDGVRVVRYDVPSKRDPSFALRYAYEVGRAVNESLASSADEAQGPIVLHGHFPVPALVPALRRKPFLYTLHAPVWRELLIERQGSYLLPRPLRKSAVASLRSAERMVVRRAATVLTLSRFMQREVTYLDVTAGKRTVVLPGGVDMDFFCPAASVQNQNLRQPTARTGQVLFTARRHVPRTGVAELVEAMSEVVRHHPDVRLRVAGEGPQTPAIADRIVKLGLTNNVTLLGRISAEALRAEYRDADLAVTPTQTLEGFGLATAEALACGTPCLVTPEGANPEVVESMSSSLVCRDSSPAGLAAGITGLLEDNQRLLTLRSEARGVAESRFDWSTVVEEHLELYRRFIARHETAT